MEDRNWERWGALGGILFVVLVAITALLPGYPPRTGDSARKITDFIADNGDEIRWAATTGGLAVIALFWWLGSVWRLMRRGEGGSPRLTVVAFAGAVFAAVMATIGAVSLAVIPVIGTHTFANSQVRYFYILSADLAVATLFGAAVFVGAFSLLIIRRHVLPAIIGWLGLIVALLGVVGGPVVSSTRDVFFYASFVAFISFLVWVIIVSILMFVEGRDSSDAGVVAAADVPTA
ncbi:MAG TPA: hypothetical protein VK549_11965 [Acidimicrobiia bacterium]|nr:hypothetical protein [Acidimicrobiia bacterium]